MKESYVERLATHGGPESCGVLRKESVEALTGVRAGRVFSRAIVSLQDADAVSIVGRPYRPHRYREMRLGPARSKTPCTYGNTSLEIRGDMNRPDLIERAVPRPSHQHGKLDGGADARERRRRFGSSASCQWRSS